MLGFSFAMGHIPPWTALIAVFLVEVALRSGRLRKIAGKLDPQRPVSGLIRVGPGRGGCQP